MSITTGNYEFTALGLEQIGQSADHIRNLMPDTSVEVWCSQYVVWAQRTARALHAALECQSPLADLSAVAIAKHSGSVTDKMIVSELNARCSPQSVVVLVGENRSLFEDAYEVPGKIIWQKNAIPGRAYPMQVSSTGQMRPWPGFDPQARAPELFTR